MNNPHMTQTQRESTLAARAAAAGDPERIRRTLRLDNPHMWGARRAKEDPLDAEGHIPTPVFHAS